MQFKTTMRFHLTQLQWLLSKSQEIESLGEGVEKKANLSTVAGNDIGVATGKRYSETII